MKLKMSSSHERNTLKKSTWKFVQSANFLKIDLDYNTVILYHPLVVWEKKKIKKNHYFSNRMNLQICVY